MQNIISIYAFYPETEHKLHSENEGRYFYETLNQIHGILKWEYNY